MLQAMCIIQWLCTMPSDCTQPLAVLGKVRNGVYFVLSLVIMYNHWNTVGNVCIALNLY